jgi:hypothetical protein
MCTFGEPTGCEVGNTAVVIRSRRAARRALGCLALAALLGLVADASAAPLSLLPLSLQSAKGVRPGMSAQQVSTAWKVPIEVEYALAFPGCGSAMIKSGGLLGATAWFQKGHFASATFTRGVRTTAGISVGANLADLRDAYGPRLYPHLHPYSVPNTYDQYVRSTTKPYTYLYFSLVGGRIKSIAFGNGFVFAEEGCA